MAEVYHPGKILREVFIEPSGLTQRALANEIGVSPAYLCDIANERRSISARMAIRLGERFSNEPMFWMTLQARYDLARELATPKQAGSFAEEGERE